MNVCAAFAALSQIHHNIAQFQLPLLWTEWIFIISSHQNSKLFHALRNGYQFHKQSRKTDDDEWRPTAIERSMALIRSPTWIRNVWRTWLNARVTWFLLILVWHAHLLPIYDWCTRSHVFRLRHIARDTSHTTRRAQPHNVAPAQTIKKWRGSLE